METKAYLKSFFTEHWKYMAVSTACKLNLFDEIQEQGSSSTYLSKVLNLDSKLLNTLLESLLNEGFVEKKDGLYFINEKSTLLTENNPETLKYACINWSEEHLIAWQSLDYTIKTGKSSFENSFGMNFFDYIQTDKHKLNNYHKAMDEYARDDYKNICDIVDFNIHKSIMDVGGGYGALINQIKGRFSSIDCYLFDLREVVENARQENIQKISGSFLIEIPKCAEAIILSRVIHDWDDEKSEIILSNCYNALPSNGFLYIIENCIDLCTSNLSLLTLNMKSMCNSFERTSNQYIHLATQAGLVYERKKKLNELQTILTFKKI
jgi:C-methyltransferase